MNKHETSKLYHDAGFVTPKEVLVSGGYKQKGHDDLLDFAMPVIVKPLAQGSSFGVSKVTERGGLEAAIDDA
jgi:D-alanine-D-alanine ligase-like ATP-grasp enzyme